MNMFCPQCGGTVKEGDAFCEACGFRTGNAQQMQQPFPMQSGNFQTPAFAMPGSKMLKVCSILYIILGALSIIASLAIAASVHGTFTTAGILILIFVDGGAVVIGIIGLRLCTRPSAAAFFIAAGIIFIPLYVLFLAFGGGASLGLGIIVLAILYIVGGAKLQKSARVFA
jgi:hypothetical protein